MNKEEYDLDYIRKTYGVPACIGQRIIYDGDKFGPTGGVITGAEGAHIKVLLDNDSSLIPKTFHPTWKITYLKPINTQPASR